MDNWEKNIPNYSLKEKILYLFEYINNILLSLTDLNMLLKSLKNFINCLYPNIKCTTERESIIF